MTRAEAFRWSEILAATSQGNLVTAFFERLSVPLTYGIANWTHVSANQVTRAGGLCGLGGSVLFLLGHPTLAGCAYFAFLMLDCSDGAIARLRGQASSKGADLDLWTDRLVLLAAALGFSWVYAARGDTLAAWLVQAYLAAHYCTDLGWLMAERSRANRPTQFDALKAELHKSRTPTAFSSPRWVRAVGRFERAIRPQPWLCNVAFLLGPCLVSQSPRYALVGLLWCLGTPRLIYLARRAK